MFNRLSNIAYMSDKPVYLYMYKYYYGLNWRGSLDGLGVPGNMRDSRTSEDEDTAACPSDVDDTGHWEFTYNGFGNFESPRGWSITATCNPGRRGSPSRRRGGGRSREGENIDSYEIDSYESYETYETDSYESYESYEN